MSNPPPEDSKTVVQQDTKPPQTPPDDRFAYRIAVGSVGVALVAFLIGAAIIAAGGKPVPTQYWSTGSAIAGALLGILAPTPTRQVETATAPGPKYLKTFAAAIIDLWRNRALFILLLVFGFSLGFAIANNSSQLEAVAAAAGGALVGLLAPPPGGGH